MTWLGTLYVYKFIPYILDIHYVIQNIEALHILLRLITTHITVIAYNFIEMVTAVPDLDM